MEELTLLAAGLSTGSTPGVRPLVGALLLPLTQAIRVRLAGMLGLAPGLLIQLRPDHAQAYPSVPPGVWLTAHRRIGDRDLVWLDSAPVRRKPAALFTGHVELHDWPGSRIVRLPVDPPRMRARG